jgi:hypothetical protein
MTWWGWITVKWAGLAARSDGLVIEEAESRPLDPAFLWRAEQHIHSTGEPRGTIFVSKKTGTALAATDGSSQCRLVQLYDIDGWCTWTFSGYRDPSQPYYAIRAWNNSGYNLSTNSPGKVPNLGDGLVTLDWDSDPWKQKYNQEWRFHRILYTRDEVGAYGLLFAGSNGVALRAHADNLDLITVDTAAGHEVDPAFLWRLEQYFTPDPDPHPPYSRGGAPAGLCVINKLTEMALGATPDNGRCRLVPLGAVDGFSTWTFGGPSLMHWPKFYGPLRAFQNDDMNLNVSGGRNLPGDVVITFGWGGGRANEIWRFDSSLA